MQPKSDINQGNGNNTGATAELRPVEERGVTATESEEQTESGFDIVRLDEYGPESIITEHALAKLFGRHPSAIKRAVTRGELPASTRLLGTPVWTVGSIVRHIEARLVESRREKEKLERRVQELRP
jgi:hypothetical protein